jgi:hypothetical protein
MYMQQLKDLKSEVSPKKLRPESAKIKQMCDNLGQLFQEEQEIVKKIIKTRAQSAGR